jgi:osmotically-inducible protein OsmY
VVDLTKRVLSSSLIGALLSLTSACATDPPKTASELQANREISGRVESALKADRFLFTRHISVRVDSGVVHLEGYVWSPTDIYEAKRIAKRVPGVTVVVDELELQRRDFR